MKKLVQETDYLSDEYETIKLWGDCPNGDVPFDLRVKKYALNPSPLGLSYKFGRYFV